MERWVPITILVCIVGFFKDFRPSEYYIYEFLTGPGWNISGNVVQQEVYPFATYGYLVQSVFLFLFTDFMRYQPLIVLLGFCGIAVYAILLWDCRLYVLQMGEIIYGTYMACEVAYYTYMYAKVPKESYEKVTSWARASVLLGRFISAVLSQVLVSMELIDLRAQTFITFGAQIIATIFALMLPLPQTSIYFNQPNPSMEGKMKLAWNKLYEHFKLAYKEVHVWKWSLWWAMGTAGFLQVQSYVQPLWKEIEEHKGAKAYNAGVEALLTLMGAIAAIMPVCMHVHWAKGGMILIFIASVIQGSCLIISAQTFSVIVAYVCYIVFGCMYHFTITVISSQVAKFIPDDSYGLVFGVNTFCALLLQTIILCVVVEDFALALDPRDQFFVYGGIFFFIAFLFIFFSFITCEPQEETEQADDF